MKQEETKTVQERTDFHKYKEIFSKIQAHSHQVLFILEQKPGIVLSSEDIEEIIQDFKNRFEYWFRESWLWEVYKAEIENFLKSEMDYLQIQLKRYSIKSKFFGILF